MKADHGRSLALLARWVVCALALAHVPLSAWAVNSGNIGKAGITRGTGGTTSINAPPQSNAGGSTIPISPSVGGWTQAGNYGFPTGATSPTVGHLTANGEFVVGGSVKYPMQAKYPVNFKGLAAEAGKALATLGCSLAGANVVLTLACTAAMPYVWDWMSRAGARRNPTTGELERKDATVCTVAPCYTYYVGTKSVWDANGGPAPIWTAAGACSYVWDHPAVVSMYSIDKTDSYTRFVEASGACFYAGKSSAGASKGQYGQTALRAAISPASSEVWLPSSMDDIAPYMGGVWPDGRVAGEIIAQGGEVPLDVPTVTGPSSIQGPETTKQNGDGTKEVSRTTYNFNTAGNTITNTSNVTTTNNFNAAGAVTNTTTTTTNNTGAAAPAASAGETEPPPGQCDQYPDSLGCAKLDTPAVEMPKATKNITYAEESRLGNGSCPADVMWSPQSISGTYKFINWQQACGWAAQLKWIVLLLATWAAFWIVMPGNTQVKPQ